MASSSSTSALKEDKEYTPVDAIPDIVDSLRDAFLTDFSKSYEWRKQQLKSIQRMVDENEQAFIDAVQQDLQRPKYVLRWGKLLSY